ncbi:hypothetical protein DLJ48_03040 [Oenococcus sicerae]|nr:GW dipeptide domain-containing protein [Oenococcus sicerae]QAS69569.2 hypothetical protein DLJ48_03040 [Oenococcus sicerae]
MSFLVRKKIYKSGKLWLVGAGTFLFFSSCSYMNQQTVNADVVTPSELSTVGVDNGSSSFASSAASVATGDFSQADSSNSSNSSSCASMTSQSDDQNSLSSITTSSVAASSASASSEGSMSSNSSSTSSASSTAPNSSQFIDISDQPQFKIGDHVEIKSTAISETNGYDLVPHRGWVGTVTRVMRKTYSRSNWEYQVFFQDGLHNTHIAEQDLQLSSLALVQATVNGSEYIVPLQTQYSGDQNDEQLQLAFVYASNHAGTNIQLPSGNFNVGAAGPKNLNSTAGNIIISSNTSISGNNTNLVVNGQMIWVGLATGTRAIDGVSNFTMSNVNIQAHDLIKGDFFIIMTDHGNNWNVNHNSFTMVETKGEHIFDLGGLQNSKFSNNKFIGYAPDLVRQTSIGESNAHDYYAESIQLDAAYNNGGWDAGYMSKVDPNQKAHNVISQQSSNIVISDNQFLPYKNASGKLIAYSSGVGQHSTHVGNITIKDNVFDTPLVDWVQTVWPGQHLAPIHFWAGYGSLNVSNNVIVGVFPVPKVTSQLVNNQRVISGSVLTSVVSGENGQRINPKLKVKIIIGQNSQMVIPEINDKFTFTVPSSWDLQATTATLSVISTSVDPISSSDLWESYLENVGIPKPVPAKFSVGTVVQISSNASRETNGYNLSPHRKWIGTVVAVTAKSYSNSQWEYKILYSNGQDNVYVSEQDLNSFQPATITSTNIINRSAKIYDSARNDWVLNAGPAFTSATTLGPNAWGRNYNGHSVTVLKEAVTLRAGQTYKYVQVKDLTANKTYWIDERAIRS